MANSTSLISTQMALECQPVKSQAFRPGICSDFSENLATERSETGFLGATICFPDGSCWKLVKALTDTRYQSSEPPFEARQVFVCECTEDPNDTYSGITEAVIKVKYQVKGTDEGILFFQKHATECQQKVRKWLSSDSYVQALDDLSHAKQLLHRATSPVETPHRYTIAEIKALEHFRKTNCTHTPHLLGVVGDYLDPGVDEEAMIGGYAMFILMTKVPGERIGYDVFWSKTVEERDQMRRAFKTALLELWRRSISPYDSALRNLIWDENGHKCYIVDFEDYNVVNIPDPEARWKDIRYNCWGLAEKCRKKFC